VKNLYTRTITGVVFVALTIGSLILHPFAFITVIFIFMIAALIEFFHLTGKHDIHPQWIAGTISASIMYIVPALAAFGIISPKSIAFLPLLLFVFFVAEIFRNKPNALQNIAFSIFAVIYIAIPFTLLIFLMSPIITEGQPHWHIVFSFFVILWAHDTFAYLTGMWLGKHKLFEKISPKKTWEGSFGGLIFALLAAFVLSLFFTELSTVQWMTGALIIAVTGTFGDLSESLLKRNFNVKDSGKFFPGHGGVLDRFDAVLFAAPALFCYLILLNL
jgi:phosphatidate cytidylyltransferase